MVSYAQNLEDVLLARVFRGRQSGFYVDVGAMDPSDESVTKHFYDAGWHGINVEPNPYFFRKLVEERPRDLNLNCAVGPAQTVGSFYLFDQQGISTCVPRYFEHFSRLFEGKPIEVVFQPLNDILANAPHEIAFLKIDVEGWEETVLSTVDLSIYRPEVILVEAVDPIDFSPTWPKWDALLTTGSYEFVWFDGLNRFYVREESSELRRHFGFPPGIVRDPYEPAVQMRTRLERDGLLKYVDSLKEEIERLSRENAELCGHLQDTRDLAPLVDLLEANNREISDLRAAGESSWHQREGSIDEDGEPGEKEIIHPPQLTR